MGDATNLVYEEIRARLRDQAAQLELARNRAGSVVAVGAVAASFLGGAALEAHPSPGLIFWTATGLFVATVIVGLSVLVPSEKVWHINPDPRVLVDSYIDADEAEAKRALATHMVEWVEENTEQLRPLHRRVKYAVWTMGSSIVLFLIELGGIT